MKEEAKEEEGEGEIVHNAYTRKWIKKDARCECTSKGTQGEKRQKK